MKNNNSIILSVSRRSDIPAFYMPWFMLSLEKGIFKLANSRSDKIRLIPVSPQSIKAIVMWSKNFGPFIRKGYADKLKDSGYNLLFNFTINSNNTIIEPHTPKLINRLEQVSALVSKFGPNTVQWRFDPICHFKIGNGEVRNNLGDFEKITDGVSKLGVTTCVTSFMDHYKKIQGRTSIHNNFNFINPPDYEKTKILLRMQHLLDTKGMMLKVCCERDLLKQLPSGSKILPSSCVPGNNIAEINNEKFSQKKDLNQRRKAGCNCTTSIDVGDYQQHPCYHSCLFCYANPAPR